MVVVKNVLRHSRTQSIEREEHYMNNTTTKQALLNRIISLATASVLVASPSVFAAGGSGSASYEGAGTTEQQQSVGIDRQGTGTDQELGGTQDLGQQQDQELSGTQDMDQGLGENTEEFGQELDQELGSTEDMGQQDQELGGTQDMDQGLDQELGGTRGIDDTNQTEAFDQESRITGTQDIGNQQGQRQNLSDFSQEEIQDREIVNLEGQELGSVEEVITDADGSISGVVVSVGGTFGMGASEVFASADEIQVSEDQLVWQTSLDEDALAEREEYQAAGTTNQ